MKLFNNYTCMLGIILSVILFSCKDTEFDQKDTRWMNEEIEKGYLTVIPVDTQYIDLFVNLGHQSPPGHTFPSDHGGFYLKDIMTIKNIYAPGDMIITKLQCIKYTYASSDYTIELSSEKGRFKVVFGHLQSIDENIMALVAEPIMGGCDEFITNGEGFTQCYVDVNIPVSAGDVVGTVGGDITKWAFDFGTYDKKRPKMLATDKYSDYYYELAVSPFDYYTDEIVDILKPICGDWTCGSKKYRTVEPIGGTTYYDIGGTIQGLWFNQNESFSPEIYHICFVFDNVEPDIPVFSTGISIEGLDSKIYTFKPQNTGVINRNFKDVTPDGKTYLYYIFDLCRNSPSNDTTVLLVKMLNDTELKVENQSIESGPPWIFTSNATLFER